MIKNLINSLSKPRPRILSASNHLFYFQHFNFTVKPGPFITSVEGMPIKKKRSSKKKDLRSNEDDSPVVDSPKVLFKPKTTEETKDEPSEAPLYVEEENEKESKPVKKSIFMKKQELAGAKIKEIQDIQNIKQLKDFLDVPTNMTLLLSERHLLFDRIIKIISLQAPESYPSLNPSIQSFLEKYELALQGNEDLAQIISVFNANAPRSMYITFTPFFTNCFDMILKHPKRISKNLNHILNNIMKFFTAIDLNKQHQDQVSELLKGMEDVIESFNIQTKMLILRIMRVSKVYNPRILDYMLNYCDQNFDMMNYEDLFDVIWTVFQERSMNPYEMFYRLRIKFNDNHKTLKPFTIIRTLGVYCKLKMNFMEGMYENMFKVLGEDKIIKDFNHIDAVLVLNYYGKIRYKDEKLFDRYLEKVKANLNKYSENHLKILLLTLADLNYQDKSIYLMIYKHYNLLQLISDIEKEETLTEFEKQYFQAVCEYIISKNDIPQIKPESTTI